MPPKQIGTIIHGALGDCYEQLLAIKELRKAEPHNKWTGFFAAEERLNAMKHFDLNMLDEIYPASEISNVNVDTFFLFQVRDPELRRDIIEKLPPSIRCKMDITTNRKPWAIIKKHNFKKSGLSLELSDLGKNHFKKSLVYNEIDLNIFKERFTVGYLWRHRRAGGAIKTYFQPSSEWIIKTKSELLNRLTKDYNAHIFICGMNKDKHNLMSGISEEDKLNAGLLEGEHRSKYTDAQFDISTERCTYLRGTGFAAEIETLSMCDLLLLMPSGFSEALWMKQKPPTLLLDPPPDYMIKLWKNFMPLFNNYKPAYVRHNTFTRHTADNVMKMLKKQNLLP